MHGLSHSLISKILECYLVNYSYSALNDPLISEEKEKVKLYFLMYLILYLLYNQTSF